jgi:hypothetical protein
MTETMRVIIRGWDQDKPYARQGWAARFHIRSTCPALVTARKRTETDEDVEHVLALSEAIEKGWSPCGRCAQGVSITAVLHAPLEVTEDEDEVRENIRAFNDGAEDHLDRVQSLFSYTSYWVYEPDEGVFGPSKFCGFRNMTFPRYDLALDEELEGASFNGTVSRRGVEDALGDEYVVDEDLHDELAQWAERFIPGVFDTINQDRWRFVRLPAPDQDAEAAGATEGAESKRSGGQGFASSKAVRDAVELRAMDAAKAYFEGEGYDWEDTSANRPYDLFCTDGDGDLYVEVKGTQTDGSAVFLTKNEVRHARRNPEESVLFVLHSIEVETDEGGSTRASGGDEVVLWPWAVDDGVLIAISYRYDLPQGE